MRKKWSLFFIMLVSFATILSACGTGKEKSEGTDKEDNGSKSLRVVTAAEYAPFEYMDKGEIVGFDIDLINAVAKEAGYTISVDNVGWDPLFVEIGEERADLSASAITINDDRKQTYDFSAPYFLSTNMIMVKEGSSIKTAGDLKDKKVAVQNGTTGQDAVEGILGKNNENVKKFENIPLAIMELKNGGVDAVVADNTVVEEYVANNPKDKLIVINDEEEFAPEFFGFLLPKGSKLKTDLDEALKAVIDNGTYTKIYKEWFGVEPKIEKLKEQQ
ncbi:basic amino acid ABC transporter substrate-binding protein [Bacillus marasmi]|uniref:basic amino acid ABC transporter substrate-binding protein n=1 Tax=Bacillus marasmi TaxID=1926279 RepID=UPI0011C9A347|nr:basic amino acid ABC transporter substrate-binding protein [Bacillus marasmi]